MFQDEDKLDLADIQNPNQDDELIDLPEPKSKKSKLKSVKHSDTKHESIKAGVAPKPSLISPAKKKIKQLKEIKEESDDMIYKNQLIKKIEIYHKHFSKYLKGVKCDQLDKKNINQLEDILTKVKDAVQSRNTEDELKGYMNLVPIGIEKTGNFVGLELDGYAQYVSSNPEFHDSLMEVLIESNYLDNLKMDPKMRLAKILGTSAVLIHTSNKMHKQKLETNLSATIDGSLFKDL